MKLHYKVALIGVGITLILSILGTLTSGDEPGLFFILFGIIALLLSGVFFLFALGFLVAEKRHHSSAFFITSGILILIGLGSCGASMAMM